MSRSIRRRPFAPYCGGSQKDDKRICNRTLRHANRQRLRVHGDERAFMTPDEAYNVYNWSQDGTRHYAPYRERPGFTYREWYRWVKAK